MALLTLTEIRKTYDENRPLLTGVSLVVGDSDRIGLIGPNGAGKSTLLKIMAGREIPDTGQRVMRRGLQVGYLEQEPRFPADLSIHEAVRLGLSGREKILEELEQLYALMAAPETAHEDLDRYSRRQERLQLKLDDIGGHDVEHKIEAAIDGVGLLDGNATCGELSGGEARRVALAQLLVATPDVMLLDEPTNHLDAFVVAWLERKLASLKVPLVLVTHDRFLLDRVTNRIIEIDRGQAFPYEGSYSKYVELRTARLESEAKTERSRLLLLRRETAWMRAGVQGRGTKAKARIQRYHDLADSSPISNPDDLQLAFPAGPRLGTKVIELHNISHSFGDHQVLPQMDLTIENGMRLGVIGANGAGKSTLLNILLRKLKPSQGEVVFGETVATGSIEQKRSDLEPSNTVVEEIAGKADHVVIGGRAIHIVGFLDRFLFPGEHKFVTIGSLSGGERGRVLLAKLMLSGANVLVLDEPTNDLDLGTLRALEEALLAFKGAVIVVSHDRWFLDRISTHVLHLDKENQHPRLHTGSASSLLQRIEDDKKSASAPAEKPKSNATVNKAKAASPERANKLTFKERRELEEVQQRIDGLEEKLQSIDKQLADPATYQGDPDKVVELNLQREKAQQDLEKRFARWEKLAERDV
ncbi:MAG: ATP-binding cassette domain-containing protein [Planctomycetes bacterium]|nr:ATP-binding cassette domain-containing protein [Planctomycetota bacterium]